MNSLRKKYIRKLLSNTLAIEKVQLAEILECSECERRLDYLEEYYIINKKVVCKKECIKNNEIRYEGYVEEYLNDLFLKFYKVFPKEKMRTYDIVSCQILPVDHNGTIKYHIDVFYRYKKDFENLYKTFSKCPFENCEKKITKDKFEVMFYSDHPEKIFKCLEIIII